jgi:hypothetical protein
LTRFYVIILPVLQRVKRWPCSRLPVLHRRRHPSAAPPHRYIVSAAGQYSSSSHSSQGAGAMTALAYDRLA